MNPIEVKTGKLTGIHSPTISSTQSPSGGRLTTLPAPSQPLSEPFIVENQPTMTR
jgi:hypothetical protein